MEDKKIITYRPDIDGLRAVAVMLVIAFHAFPDSFAGGFIGVDIFFVISGFLISGIILKTLKNNEFSYLNFYKRRVRRLFPALIIVLLSCLIFGWFFLFSQEYSFLGEHTFFGAAFISNIIYFLESGYFDISSSLKPLMHLWSLGVEEQFYIIWPVLLVFLYKKSKNPLLIISFLLFFSFTLNIFMGSSSPDMAFYLPITRFWEFLSGAIIAYINFSNDTFFGNLINRLNVFKKKKFFTPSLISWLGLLFVFISLSIVSSDNFYKGYVAVLVFGVSLLILSGKESFVNRKIFSNKFLVFIGLISYPLYLWHWPLFSFAKILSGEEVSTSIKLILIALSFILAWGTYVFIEKPLRYLKNKKITLILCLLMIFVATLGSVVYLKQGFLSRFPAQEKMLENVSISPVNLIPENRSLLNGTELCKKMYPKKKGICTISSNEPNKVVIIGDSHTRMVFEGYKNSFANQGYSLVNLGVSGCGFPIPDDAEKYPGKEHCDKDIEVVMNIIATEKPRAIIISNNALYTKDYKYMEFGMDKTLSRLPSDIPIIWILQTPKIPFSLTKCLKRNIFSSQYLVDCSFSKESFVESLTEYNKIVERLKEKYPSVISIDPTNALCPNDRCEVIINGNYIYEDIKAHISVFGGKYIAEKFPLDKYLPDLKNTEVK